MGLLALDRENTKRTCHIRQGGRCAICGHGGADAMHEAILKRSDLPKSNKIMDPRNCVVVHNDEPCSMPHIFYGNTKRYDVVCIVYLLWEYGSAELADFIKSANLAILPGRAKLIIDIQKQRPIGPRKDIGAILLAVQQYY